ncbi:hypothetical protein ACIQB5_50680 [Streptomyces sp. NPDC088560]|uniref:hypothetical protein n=1 Tax=Streptomyces sp. NPDC088560 TaxID=3365868 RepID=UPI00382082B0
MAVPREYPDEFRPYAVSEVRATGLPIAHVAMDLGIRLEALRGRVRQGEVHESDEIRRALASGRRPGGTCAVEGAGGEDGPMYSRSALVTRSNDACAIPPKGIGTSRVPAGTAGFSQPGGTSPRQMLR